MKIKEGDVFENSTHRLCVYAKEPNDDLFFVSLIDTAEYSKYFMNKERTTYLLESRILDIINTNSFVKVSPV